MPNLVISIIDDDSAVREGTIDLLNSAGFVVCARNAVLARPVPARAPAARICLRVINIVCLLVAGHSEDRRCRSVRYNAFAVLSWNFLNSEFRVRAESRFHLYLCQESPDKIFVNFFLS